MMAIRCMNEEGVVKTHKYKKEGKKGWGKKGE